MVHGRYDPAERKQATRHGREKGCRVYIAGEAFEAAGLDTSGPPPYYRVWAGERGRFILTMYKEK